MDYPREYYGYGRHSYGRPRKFSGIGGAMKHRKWTEEEDAIIRENYPNQGVIYTTKLLHAAGFIDREPLSVIRQASKLKVKRVERKKGWTNEISGGY